MILVIDYGILHIRSGFYKTVSGLDQSRECITCCLILLFVPSDCLILKLPRDIVILPDRHLL